MKYLLNVDEAIDRKFLVIKNIKGQAEPGTIIHVLDAEKVSNQLLVTYRVARFNGKFHDYQDYNAKFDDLASFCKWAQPDNFIARNYESFSLKDIQHYIKVKNRTFASFCLPIIIVLAAIVWAVALFVLKGTIGIIAGSALTVVVFLLVAVLFKSQKKKEKMRMYKKMTSRWGVVLD
jgi:hypothetical protein